MKRISAFYSVTVTFLLSIILFSCGSEEGSFDLQQETSKFIKSNNKIVLFGKVDLKAIIDKANLDKKEYDVVSIVTDEMGNLQNGIDMTNPVYFAFEGPLKQDGTPEVAYLLMKAKSDTAFIAELERRSYPVEEAGKISYTEDGDFSVGVKGNLAIAIIKHEESNAKKDLKAAFKMLEGDVSGGKVDEILATQGDIVLGTSLEKLYETSSTDLEKLDPKKKEKLEEMVSDSYVQTSFRFEPGQAVLESKNLFSEALMAIMPFKKDDSGKLLSKVNKGSGTPIAGVAFNMDVTKMEQFMNDYSPETIDGIFKSFGFSGNMFGGLPVASMATNGQAAGLFSADMENNAMHLNFFVNASKLGRDLGTDQINKSEYGQYFNISSDEDGILGHMTFGMGESDLTQTIELPDVCEDFGNEGVSFFLYLNDIDVEDFGMFGPMELLEDVQYVLFDANNEGVKLIIKSKKDDVNFLENSTDVALKFLSSEVKLLSM